MTILNLDKTYGNTLIQVLLKMQDHKNEYHLTGSRYIFDAKDRDWDFFTLGNPPHEFLEYYGFDLVYDRRGRKLISGYRDWSIDRVYCAKFGCNYWEQIHIQVVDHEGMLYERIAVNNFLKEHRDEFHYLLRVFFATDIWTEMIAPTDWNYDKAWSGLLQKRRDILAAA